MRLSTILNSLLLLAAGTLAAPVNEPRNDAVAENRGCGTAQTYDKIAVGLMAKNGNCQELAQVPQEFHVGNGCACDFYTGSHCAIRMMESTVGPMEGSLFGLGIKSYKCSEVHH